MPTPDGTEPTWYGLAVEWADFWRIVEGARGEVGSDTERVAQALLRRLRALTPDEIERVRLS